MRSIDENLKNRDIKRLFKHPRLKMLDEFHRRINVERKAAHMKEALHAEEDGVAIAAPQIGESLRMFVVNIEILALANRIKRVDGHKRLEDMVFINPEIVKISKKKHKVEEGCLSIRWLYGQVLRSEKVTIKAYDETGKPLQRGASGLLAQIFQH